MRSVRVISGVILVVLCAYGVWRYRAAPDVPPAPPPVAVEVVAVKRGNMAERISAVGSIASVESAILRAEVEGRVVDIALTEGMPVRKGEVLLRLDAASQKADLARAQANLALWQNNVTRRNTLAKGGFSARVSVEEAQAELALARANVQAAEAMLEKTVVRAPFDGVMGIRSVNVGDVVQLGQALVNLEQGRSINVMFRAPQRYASRVQMGNPVRFTSDVYPGKEFAAAISAIDPKIDATSRSITVQARVDMPESAAALYPGQFVAVSTVGSTHEGVLMIPDQALIATGVHYYVFVVDNHTVARRKVSVGLRADSHAEITDGLKEGDKVVTAGQQKLRDGVRVKMFPGTRIDVIPSPEEHQK